MDLSAEAISVHHSRSCFIWSLRKLSESSDCVDNVCRGLLFNQSNENVPVHRWT